MVFIPEETIETLKAKLQDKDSKLKNQAAELNHLTNEVIPDLKSENKKLKALKIELTEALEKSTKKYFNQLEINADLSDSVAKKGAALQLSKVRVEEIEKLVMEMEEESAAKIKAAEDEAKKLKDDFDNVSVNPEALDELDDLKEKVDELEKQLREKDRELNKKSKDIKDIKEDFADSDNIIKRLKADVEQLKDTLKEKESIIAKSENLRGEKAKLESKLKDIESKLDNKIKEYDKLNTTINSKDKAINSLKAKNQKLVDAVKSQSKRGFFDRLTNKSVDISDLED